MPASTLTASLLLLLLLKLLLLSCLGAWLLIVKKNLQDILHWLTTENFATNQRPCTA